MEETKEKFLPKTLETERLILRPLTFDDQPAIYKWASDPEVARFQRYATYKSQEESTQWLTDLYTEPRQLDYGFVWKETGELIGSGGIIFHPETNDWTLGYGIRRDMWGKGITTEACRKIIEYARETYDVNKIVAVFANENPRSGNVMRKLGMTYHCDCEYSKFDGSVTFQAKNYEIVYHK